MAKQIQHMLAPGLESIESFTIILSLTSLRSENMIRALRIHLVQGVSIENACATAGVSTSNFHRDLGLLNDVARKIDRYFEINYRKSVK